MLFALNRISLKTLQKGGDTVCVNQEEAKEHGELGDVAVVVAVVDAVHPSDVSCLQKRNRNGWKNTKSN